MRYHPTDIQHQHSAALDRLCRHYDHLKALVHEYTRMRQEHTYARMADPSFATDPAALAQVDGRQWLRTSLIVDLATPAMQPLLDAAAAAYTQFGELFLMYDPTCKIDIYVTSAHITVKTIVGGVAQDVEDLQAYLPYIRPVVHHWLEIMGKETLLYGVGLFSSLTRERGLALGLQFYPSLPLLQLIRGAVGVALYEATPPLPLHPEGRFHTMLTHSTGFRARLTDFPLPPDLINDFRGLLESYDRHCFGLLDQLTPADFIIRHGYSDQLIPLADLPCA